MVYPAWGHIPTGRQGLVSDGRTLNWVLGNSWRMAPRGEERREEDDALQHRAPTMNKVKSLLTVPALPFGPAAEFPTWTTVHAFAHLLTFHSPILDQVLAVSHGGPITQLHHTRSPWPWPHVSGGAS